MCGSESYNTDSFNSDYMCCACGGGYIPGNGQCTDIDGEDSFGDSCDYYTDGPDACGQYDTGNFIASENCCACGGGDWVETVDDCTDTDNGATD